MTNSKLSDKLKKSYKLFKNSFFYFSSDFSTLSHNKLNTAKVIIDDYLVHYGRVDKIYSEYDLLGSNKSSSVLSTIRHEYAKAKSRLNDDQLFFEVISKVQDKVLNSSNYTSIPFDELELCVNILVVDAFIRCKIFENPNNYNYATT